VPQINFVPQGDNDSLGVKIECLTPKGPNYIFWQYSNLGQLTTNGIFIFFL